MLPLCFSVGGASAKVSIFKGNMASVTSSGVDYDAVTGRFEWKAEYGNLVTMFDNLKGQASKYKHLKLKIANPSGEYRLIFYTDLKAGTNVQIVKKASDTNVEIDLSTLNLDGKTLDDIDRISIAGQGASGSLTIFPADVTLSTDDIETLTVTTTVNAQSAINTPFQWYDRAGLRTENVENNFGNAGERINVLWGYNNGNSEANGYFNLKGYSALRVKVNNFDDTNNTTFRVMSADNSHATITMTGVETLVPFKVSKCTSLKSASGHTLGQQITSIDFIGEYQALNTKSRFDIAASTGSNVSYDRTFTKDQPCTICLPFALSAEELANVGKAYALSSVNASKVNASKATFTLVQEIKAYTPYLLIPSADGELLENIIAAKDIADVPDEAKTSVSGDYSFVGTLQAETSVKKDGMEVYGFSASGGKFVRVGENASINAFRAYITVPTDPSTAASRSIDIDFGGTTGINEIQNAHSSSAAATYDVAGKRVDKNYKGVVIRNGKKMIQK